MLAISNNRGLDGEEPLRYAKTDAERIAQVFVDLAGVRTTDATELHDATPSQVNRALGRLGAQWGDDRL